MYDLLLQPAAALLVASEETKNHWNRKGLSVLVVFFVLQDTHLALHLYRLFKLDPADSRDRLTRIWVGFNLSDRRSNGLLIGDN